MSPEDALTDYYDALRGGDPLDPFFVAAGPTVKIGVSESLVGYEAVVEGLREQTDATGDWTVESGGPAVAERDGYATFVDEVTLAWTDLETGDRHRFETRWTGTLERRDDDGLAAEGDGAGPAWTFVSMHVSAPSRESL